MCPVDIVKLSILWGIPNKSTFESFFGTGTIVSSWSMPSGEHCSRDLQQPITVLNLRQGFRK